MADDTQNQNAAAAQDEAVVEEKKSPDAKAMEDKEKAQPQEQATEAAAKEEPKKEKKAVSKSLDSIIESIEKLSVLELADLVKALEDRFGVTASAPVAMAPTSGGSATGEPAEVQTTFNVVLTSAGANKISVIKAVREILPTLGLKEAKDLVEAAPKPVLEGVNKTDAEQAKAKLTAAGATAELK